jgi:integrase
MGVYRRPDSPTWWMSLQLNGRRERLNTLVEDRQLAEDLFCAWKAEIARTRWLGTPTPDGDHTVAELITQYLKMVTPRKSSGSQQRDRLILARFATRWGKLLLRDLTALLIEAYLAKRLVQVSFATVSKELGVLKAAFRCAIRWGWASRSPLVGIALNQEGTARTRWLSDDEETRLLAHCPAWLRDIVIVGLDTGLRPGNLVGLQRMWVQSGEPCLIVPREQTKTKKLPLTIPLTRRATDIVHRYLESGRSEYLFVSQAGHAYTCAEINRALQRAAVKAGLRDICLYTLRHSFISRLVQAGVSLPEVAARAGHRDIRMTMRYAHLAPQHLRNSIATLEARMTARSENGLATNV